ncbi:MAG: cyclic-di-AMP receptor [Acidobacteriota bacterium]
MDVDRLLLAIVQREDADATIAALNQASLSVTVIASLGGFLAASNVTLLIGLQAGNVEKAMDVFKTHGHHRAVHARRDANVSGATIFVFPVLYGVRLSAAPPTPIPPFNAADLGTMKLILAIVSPQQSDQLLKTLTDWSYRGTLMSTTGGFLHRKNATILVGARAERVESIVDQIGQACMQDPRGDAATVFVLDCAQYERM